MRYDTFRKSQSCGCLKAIKARRIALSLRTHKKSGTHLYRVWQGMKARCNNPRNHRYNRYGGRGIKVCSEWENNFESFYSWANTNGYQDDLTIDRIDNDGNYTPGNCRWASRRTQSRNRSSNVLVEHKREKMTLIQLSEETGVPYSTLSARHDRGDNIHLLARPLNASTGRKRGENNHKAKITEQIARKVKRRIACGESCLSIARTMKISKHIVYDIKREKTWKHV